jgi:hypothetical protein
MATSTKANHLLLSDETQDFDPIIEDINDPFYSPKSRPKRGVVSRWVGNNVFRPCCNLVTYDDIMTLRSHTDAIKSYLTNVKTSINAHHEDLISVQTDLRNINEDYNEKIRTVQTDLLSVYSQIKANSNSVADIANIIPKYNKLFSIVMQTTNRIAETQVMSMCNMRLLSPALVTPVLLKHELNKLWQNLLAIPNNRFTLLIDLNDIQAYYKLPLLTCAQNERTVTLKFNVPLKALDHDYRLIQAISVPQTFEPNYICKLDLPDYLILDIRTSQIRGIEPISGADCLNSDQRNLCFVPQHPNTFLPNTRCIQDLYFHPNMKNVHDHCHYTCINETFPVITLTGLEEYSVANIDKVMVSCPAPKIRNSDLLPPSIDTVYERGSAASLRIYLPCTCVIKTMNHEILAHSNFPCPRHNKPLTVKKIIPAIFLNTSQMEFLNEDSYISMNLNTDLTPMLKTHLNKFSKIDLKTKIDQVNETLHLMQLEMIPKLFDFEFQTYNSFFGSMAFINLILILFLYYLLIWRLDVCGLNEMVTMIKNQVQAPIVRQSRTPSVKREIDNTRSSPPGYTVEATELHDLLLQYPNPVIHQPTTESVNDGIRNLFHKYQLK